MATVNPTVTVVNAHQTKVVWVLTPGDVGASVDPSFFTWRSVQAIGDVVPMEASNDGTNWSLAWMQNHNGIITSAQAEVADVMTRAQQVRPNCTAGASSVTVTMWCLTQ